MKEEPNQTERTCEICGRTYIATRRPMGGIGEWYNFFLCSPSCCAARRFELKVGEFTIEGMEDA